MVGQTAVAESIPIMDGQHRMLVQAERRTPVALTQLVRFDWDTPLDRVSSAIEAYRVDMCLTPRPNARGCFRETWGPHRFERIGDMFMLPAGRSLHTRAESGRQDSIVCLFDAEAVETWFEGELEWNSRRLEASLDIASPQIRGLLQRLGEEMRHPGFASETMSELISVQIALEISRYCRAINDDAASGGLAPWRLRMIDERLAQETDPPTLSDLAKLCNLSVRQLTRAFRTSRGCSIGDHIAQSRIDHAKRLLTTDACVKSIAYRLGFSSPSSFSYAFRSATGETPRQFRQRAYQGEA